MFFELSSFKNRSKFFGSNQNRFLIIEPVKNEKNKDPLVNKKIDQFILKYIL